MVMSSGPFLSPLPLPFLPFLAIFAPVGSYDEDDDGEAVIDETALCFAHLPETLPW